MMSPRRRSSLLLSFALTSRSMCSVSSTFVGSPSPTCLNPLLRRLSNGEYSSHESVAEEKFLLLKSLDSLQRCSSISEANNILSSNLLKRGRNVLYNSVRIPPNASTKVISDQDLAIQMRLENAAYDMNELLGIDGRRVNDRLSIGVTFVTITSMALAITTNQILPGSDIIRFVFVLVITFMPFLFMGYGLNNIESLQSFLVNLQIMALPSFRKRIIQHEAGHFLIGHLLGLPVASYQANSIKSAVEFYSVDDDTSLRVSQQLALTQSSKSSNRNNKGILNERLYSVPFYNRDGRDDEQLAKTSMFRSSKLSASQLSETRPFSGIDEVALDKLTAVSVAGIASEFLSFGKAEGGMADLDQLNEIFNSGMISEKETKNRIRFAMAFCITHLRLNMGALDALADVMERDGSLAECVVAIETFTNSDGQERNARNDELNRRESFRNSLSFFERFVAPNKRDINANRVRRDDDERRLQELWLKGDNPFYAAIFVSLIFLCWASSGGMSLH